MRSRSADPEYASNCEILLRTTVRTQKKTVFGLDEHSDFLKLSKRSSCLIPKKFLLNWIEIGTTSKK